MLKLLCVSGIDIGHEFELNEGTYTIGRGSQCEIIIIDSESSRRHCELTVEDNTVYLCDLKSTNGLTVNENRITEPVVLKNGDSIKIGSTTLQLYTQYEEAYISSSTKAKIAKPGFIDDEFREFTTRKTSLYDTHILKK